MHQLTTLLPLLLIACQQLIVECQLVEPVKPVLNTKTWPHSTDLETVPPRFSKGAVIGVAIVLLIMIVTLAVFAFLHDSSKDKWYHYQSPDEYDPVTGVKNV